MIAPTSEAPLYRCPCCAGPLEREPAAGEIACPGCSWRSPVLGGVATLLRAEELCIHAPFLDHYRRVRQAERWEIEPADIASLPYPCGHGPHATTWRRRAASYQALLRILHARGTRLRILDLGAGNCWLAWQLARRDHDVEALDINDDQAHGLGAATHLPPPSGSLRLVRASLERLPYGDCQFDVVIAAASLHYARDLPGAVGEAARVLRSRGMLLLLDTPLYRDASVGKQFVARQVQVCMCSTGSSGAGTTGPAYIEATALRAACLDAGLSYRERPVHGPIRAAAGRIRRRLRGALRLSERATMPLVVGVKQC